MLDTQITISVQHEMEEGKPRLIRKWRRVGRLLVFLAIALFSIFLIMEAAGIYLLSQHMKPKIKTVEVRKKALSLDRMMAKNANLKKRLSALSPKGVYIVVDTARNKLYLKDRNRTLREMVISTGSGSILVDPTGDRKWVFDTPRGELRVQSKTVNPVWIKPDWAFIEEGEPIPRNPQERIEEGVLGEYALSLGNGYLIHGTLYTRLLGRHITHGCIRVGDKDLRELYHAAQIGTKVIIF